MLLIHLSDIHIGSSPTRRAEYRAIFQQFAQYVNNLHTELIVIITGDIFHHKVRYSGEDVEDFNYLIELLKNYPVIMIPGNHDVNLNNENSVDLISPLIRWPNVKYLRDSGVYNLFGISFVHVSLIDTKDKLRDGPRGDVLLYHGSVDGSKFGVGGRFVVKDSRISVEYLSSFHLCLLGDIHQTQFVTPTAAYAGSLIQQNYGESVEKGFIVWDYKARSGKFIRLDNPNKLVRAEAVAPVDAPQHEVAETKQNITIHSDIIVESIRTLLTTRKIDPVIIDSVVKLHMEENIPIIGRRWFIKTMKWRNLFKYGDNNFIDFDVLCGDISGIIANNRAGKSSVIDVLVYGLFNTFLRGNKQCVLRRGANEFEIEICFGVLSADTTVMYKLHRKDDLKHCVLRLYKHDVTKDEWVNITKKDTVETYAEIKSLIGDVDQLKCIGVYYDGFYDIVRCSNTARIDVLSTIFGLQSVLKGKSLETKIRSIKDEIKKIGVPPTTMSAEEIVGELNRIDAQLLETTSLRDRMSTEYHTLNDNLYKLRASIPKIPRGDLVTELTKTAADLAELNSMNHEARYRAAIDESVKYGCPQGDIGAPVSTTFKFNKERAQQPCRALTDVLNDITKIKVETVPAPIDLTELRREEAELRRRMVQLKGANVDVDKTNVTIKSLRDSLESLVPLHLPDSYTQLQFAANCTECIHNKTMTVDNYQETLRENERRSALRRSTLDQIDELTTMINKRNELIQVCFSHFTINNKIQEEEKLITLREQQQSANDTLKLLKQERAEVEDIMKHRNAHWQYLQNEIKMAKVASETAAARRESLKTRQDKINDLIRAHDTFDTAQLNALQTQSTALFNKIAELNSTIGQLTSRQTSQKEHLELKRTYDAKFPELAAKLNIYTLYNDIINGKELKAVVIKYCIDDVFVTMNKVLALITDFRVAYNYVMDDRHKLDIFMIEKNGRMVNDAPSEINIPVEMASGFQRFIISIMFRIVLGESAPCAPDFLIIDEGFGCMDKQHIARLIGVLNYLRDKYKFVFIVSHIEELQNIITKPLAIEQQMTPIGICSRIDNRAQIDKPAIIDVPLIVDQPSTGPEIIMDNVNNDGAVQQVANNAPMGAIPVNTPAAAKNNSEVCVCGATITKSAMARHIKSARHAAALAKK